MKKLHLLFIALLLSCISSVFAADVPSFPWGNLPMKQWVVTGVHGVGFPIQTTKSKTYKGYISAAASVNSGHLTRRIWISEDLLGVPLQQMFRGKKNQDFNACDVSGVEIKLTWSQEDRPQSVTLCKLERKKRYYLNFSQAAFGKGAGPTKTSYIVSGASVSGK